MKRVIVYLDEACRKKRTEPLNSAQEIAFFKNAKENRYTIISSETLREAVQ